MRVPSRTLKRRLWARGDASPQETNGKRQRTTEPTKSVIHHRETLSHHLYESAYAGKVGKGEGEETERRRVRDEIGTTGLVSTMAGSQSLESGEKRTTEKGMRTEETEGIGHSDSKEVSLPIIITKSQMKRFITATRSRNTEICDRVLHRPGFVEAVVKV